MNYRSRNSILIEFLLFYLALNVGITFFNDCCDEIKSGSECCKTDCDTIGISEFEIKNFTEFELSKSLELKRNKSQIFSGTLFPLVSIVQTDEVGIQTFLLEPPPSKRKVRILNCVLLFYG